MRGQYISPPPSHASLQLSDCHYAWMTAIPKILKGMPFCSDTSNKGFKISNCSSPLGRSLS